MGKNGKEHLSEKQSIPLRNNLNYKYWDGTKNRFIRYYFYTQRGLTLLNEFRYLLMAIFAIYYALRITSFWVIPLMFMVSIPTLVFLGWLSIHHINKVMEYLNIEFATHWSRYQFELLEKQIRLIEEIKNEVKDKKNSS